MPDGRPWIVGRVPKLRCVPTDKPFYHVYSEEYGPLSANRYSKARFALVEPPGAKESAFGMFYAASDLGGALWETALRHVVPDTDGTVRVDITKLTRMRAIQLKLRRADLPMLELGQPGLRRLFVSEDQDPNVIADAQAVARLIRDPDHATTHEEARRLRHDFAAHGVDEMPVLAWPSRQCNASTVYLAYKPPMGDDWWQPLGPSIALDDANVGYRVIDAELKRNGFHWHPLATSATPSGP